MKKRNVTATTVKIDNGLYDDFKVLGIRHKIKLQTFVDKCVHLYVAEQSFRDIVNAFSLPTLSTSGSFNLSI